MRFDYVVFLVCRIFIWIVVFRRLIIGMVSKGLGVLFIFVRDVDVYIYIISLLFCILVLWCLVMVIMDYGDIVVDFIYVIFLFFFVD